MDHLLFVLIIITVFIIILLKIEKYFRIKKYGTITEAEVLGYHLKPPYYNALYIALKFNDSTNKETIILTEYAHVKNYHPFTYPSIYPYREGSIISIGYIKHSEDYKINTPLESITLLKNDKKIQPNDDGNLYEIEFFSRKSIIEFIVFTIIPLIIPLSILIFIIITYLFTKRLS